ncbi:GntR family transcriptional regulator [Cohnella sp. JJ-181]|uniref:GntR family transcriptional regulator n=1 Tax=Cohnella rhizoplanae TaxID=2974897 RepID=UPI0022FFB6BC|nr:GntR family transcriptional regulator [Cohnella sp. JJ-181]CAI6084884.1 HTH-type transcriptional repressor NagR [Cohnella sp. JJ-181]
MLDAIDRTSPIPLVHQLTQILREQIASGAFPPQSLFPTEEQLTNKYGVSRTTVRLALSSLVNEGIIYREQGRGTFVNAAPLTTEVRGNYLRKHVARDVRQVKSTSFIIESAGMVPSSKVIYFAAELPSEKVAQSLEIRREHAVWYFERVRFADDLPILLERVWIPQFLCPDLTEEHLKGSLWEYVSNTYGFEFQNASQVLRAISLSPADALLLDENQGAPALFVTGITYLKNGKPFEHENTIYNSEAMEFLIELSESSEYARIRKAEETLF